MANEKKVRPEILIIEWYDPHDDGDSWEEFKGGDKAVCCVTTGALLEETDLHFILAFNLADDGAFLRKAFIPKTHVRRVRRYKYPWSFIGSAKRVRKVLKDG